MKKVLAFLLLICVSLSLVACNSKEEIIEPQVELSETGIIYDEKFGGFYIDISIDDFNTLGFSYGDSVDVTLSSGDILTDIPYYNGYYTKTNYPLICAYPGYAHIKVQANNGDDLYAKYNLNVDTKAKVTLNQKAKYIDVQEAMDTVYKNEREAFESDEIFANYRMMVGGDLKQGIFYRSASPVDNEYNRAAYADALMLKDNVQLVIDLSDNEEDLQGYMLQDDFNSPHAASLYAQGKIVLLDMGSSYRSNDYKQKVAKGLRAVIDNKGPYLIHCVEGKDRTGFVAILIESLCNATYEQMLTDYMITYDNYYQINQNNKVNQYQAIVQIKFEDMMFYLAGVNSKEEMANVNMQEKASEYLLAAGMSEKEIANLIDVLTK